MSKTTNFIALKKIFAQLHGPKGCLWDKKQTHKSIIRGLKEEVDEFIDTVKKGNFSHMKEELGDILLHVMFQAQIASKEGKFNIEEVIEELIKKLRRRHPHVFGNVKVKSSRQIVRNWNRIKLSEKKKIGILICPLLLMVGVLAAPLTSFSNQVSVSFKLIQAKGLVDKKEIGGEGLSVVSLWDDPAKVAEDGSFGTVVSNQRPQKITLVDNQKKPRALAIVSPQHAENVIFDAKSTAEAVLFYDIGSFGSAAEVEVIRKKLESEPAFQRLVLFFKKNLSAKSLEMLTKDEEYAGILEKCFSEIFGQDMLAIGSSLREAQKELEKVL